MMKRSLSYHFRYFLALAVVLLAVNVARATVNITSASGGTSISADSTGGGWTTLGGIVIAEGANGDLGVGTNITLVLKSPGGFQFNTATTPSITFTNGRGIAAASVAVTDTSTISVTLTVSNNTALDTLVIGGTTGIQIRPTAGSPLATGLHIYRPTSGGGTAVINGITTSADGTTGSNFGTLTEIPGTVTQLTFTTQPASAVAGTAFGVQPVVATQDQFGNNSTTGLSGSPFVTLALTSGVGPLQGTVTKSISTGTASYTGLRIDVSGNKQLTVTSTNGLASDSSVVFTVSPAAASKLAIGTQPSATAIAGVLFAQQPVIFIEDQFNNIRSNDTLTVTATRSAGAGTLFGSTNVVAVGGVATFTNLAHGVVTNITINFTSGALTAATSSTVAISNGPLAQLQVLLPGETAAPGTQSGKTGTPTAQTAGTAFNVTVRAVDAGNNLLTNITHAVGITSSDLNAILPSNAALVNGSATFSLTIRTADTPTVTAQDITDGLTIGTSSAVTVTPGAFAKVQLLVPGETAAPGSSIGKTGTPITQTAGTAFTVIAHGVDANWNIVPSANGASYSMQVTSTDTNASVSPSSADLASGTTTLNVTFKTAGAATLTLTDLDNTALTNVSPAITINPGGLTKLQLLMPGETAVPGSTSGKTGTPSARTAGTSFNVIVNAVDANWNLVNTNDTVHFTSTDANATLPSDTVLANGSQTLSVTFNTAGSRTLTASDATHSTISSNTCPSTTVNVGSFAKLLLLMPGETAAAGTTAGKTGTPNPQTAGASFSVTVNAVDAVGNLISSTHTVGLSSSDANAVLPGSGALSAGARTFTGVILKTGGSVTLTASDITDGTKTPNTDSVTVNPSSFARLQLLVPGEIAAPGTASGKTGTPLVQVSGTQFILTVNAVDTNWNVISTNDTIRILSSDTNAVLPANAVLAAGTAQPAITLKTVGTATVTASNVTHTSIAGNTSPLITVGNPGLRAGPIVAIHDSELTRALEAMSATNAGTPTGPGTTGFEWWPINWHYFVMPESLKEALASDGTAYDVVSDADISAGRLLTNGQPRYPIVISLASEAVADDEISQFTNYVAAGGTLFVGSSSFTRQTNGAGRGDFAFANPMGVHSSSSSLQNWAANATFLKTIDHPLISHIPAGTLNWHMPFAADDISWGTSPVHTLPSTSLAWQVQTTDATVIAQGDGRPYITVKSYGKGSFVYHAGMQPLIAHGGYGPGMYAYGIFRNAIQAAFAAARAPLARVSAWPYSYDAALIVRHDFEDYQNMINAIEPSAQFEFNHGVKGDYYFCTGTLRVEMTNSPATIASLRRAVTNYGASIGPHNGGLKNVNNTNLVVSDYDYWHWGPDETLDMTPAGYPSGKAYASASVSNSFLDVEGWLTGITNGLRCWVAPYFNATRENSFDIEQQVGVKVTGEQKLTAFPHWTVSTATSGKRYPFLSLPVSDWFVSADIGQAMEVGHTSASVHALVDYYYNLGALINLYSHSGSDGSGTSGTLVQDYITYSLTKPRLWPANAASIYSWWNVRGSTQISPTFTTSSNQTTANISIAHASDPQTAIEVLVPASYSALQVLTNGVLASAGSYRTNGQSVKVLVGNTVTNAQIKYLLTPSAQDDFYTAINPIALTVAAPGVLANDSVGMGTNLTATLVTGPSNGTLNLSTNGGFTYTPATNFSGLDTFTYRVNDGIADGNVATVTIRVIPTASVLFLDDFTRGTDPGPVSPWVVQSGTWSVTGGTLQGGTNAFQSYGFAYLTNNWTDYAVEARIQFPAGAYGGGLGGRLNPLTGSHYAAWIYPENSPGGSRQLKLIKFQNWGAFSYNGVSFAPIQQITLPGVGTNWHTLKLAFDGSQISVFYDSNQIFNVIDAEAQPLTSGGISLDMWTESSGYLMKVDDVSVTAPVASQTIAFDPLPGRMYGDAPFALTASASSGLPVSFSVLSGPAVLSGSNVTLTGVGTVTIRASQNGDASFKGAPAVDRSFTVGPATLTVKADDKTKVYGAALPSLTASYNGFANGDTVASIAGSPSLSTTANAGSGVGSYSVTAGLGTLSASNYVFTFVSGQLTVTPAPLTVRANDAIRNFGDPDPTFTASYSGFVNGDSLGVLSGTPAFSTTATATSPQGTYPIIVTAGTLTALNYTFAFISGVLTVIHEHLLFSDNFARTNEPGSLLPWIVHSNSWTVTSGMLEGGPNPTSTYGFVYLTNVWSNFSVQARLQFPVGAFGGGVGGRLNSATGAHYAAWVYPEGSPGGSSVLKLIKFQDWSDFGYTNTAFVPIQQVALPSVGTNWHTVKLTFATNQISVYYDTNLLIVATDVESQPYTNGGISLDMWTDSTPYVMNVDDVIVTEPAADQTITFGPMANKTYGDAPFAVSATASSGLPVSFTVVSGPASISGNSISLTGVGIVTVRASQAGSTAFNAAPDVDQSFTVNPAALTVTVDSTNRAYGAANPPFTGSVIGIQNSDNIAASYSTLANTNSPVGTYSIVATLNDPGNKLSNYSVVTNNGVLTVTAAVLTVTADNKSKTYGSANPPFTGAVAGLQNGDNITAIYMTVADTGSPVGGYPIVPVLNDPSSKLGNYLVTTNNGSLTVVPATVTVTADNKSRAYGATNPPFTATFTGFVNGENAGLVSGSPAFTTTAQPASGVGTYPVSPLQGTLAASNYNFAFVDGLLTIDPATLTGTADNKSRAYGAMNPVLTVTYTGFVNGETAAIVTGTLSASTTADTNSPVGSYPITASGQSAPNYSIQYVDGTLSVTPAALSIAADDKSRAYGQTNPVLTATITGFVNGDNTNVLAGELALTTSADTNSPVGSYPIAASGLTASNYSITFSNGTLTVLPYALVVTANNQSRPYGSANPALTGSLIGIQDGDNITVTFSSAADTNSSVGTYDIVPQFDDPGARLTNYSVTTNLGVLHVTAAQLTVTANDQTRAYGAANPTLTGTVTGLQNGDNISATYSTPADASSPIGTYEIVPSVSDPGGKLANYNLIVADGTLTIAPATLTVTTEDKSRVYGSANPMLTGTLTGVQNGDGITANYSTIADASSAIGTYAIVPALNDPNSKLINYSVTISNGTLTVTAAPLSVVANNQARTYGETNPILTGMLTGVVNSDNITASFSTVATVLSPVGPYDITPSLNDPDGKLTNYSVSATNGTLTINPAILTGTADNNSRLYGGTNPVFSATYTGFVNGENTSILTGALITSTTAETNSPIGTYPISASGQSAPNYTINYVDGILSVTPAQLLVTADDKSRAYGQTNPVFTASYSGFVNGESSNVLGGALAFTTAADTNSPVGTYPIVVSGVTATNYSLTFSNGLLTVTPFALTVVADNQTRVYGATNPPLSGTLSGVQNGDGISASYTTIADPTSPVGTYAIVAALNDPNGKLTNYSVTISNGTLTVTPAALVVTADDKSRVYGSVNPTLTGTVTGVQKGDGINATYSTTADASSSVGPYAIVPSLNDPNSKLTNYSVTISNGTLTITAAPLSVVADNQARTYGATNPVFTGTLTGVVNSDNITASFASVATVLSPVGPYDITPSLSDPDGKLANYAVSSTSGTLTINPAVLIGTADNKSRLYGETNPVFTVTYTGFVNSENASIVTGTPSTSTTAETNSPVGNYPISVSGQSAPNYTIQYMNGTLSVTPAQLLVTADDKSRAYGQTNPVFTATLSGFVNGESSNVLGGALAFTTAADTNSPVGTYPIEVSGLSATNYSVIFSNGTLSVLPYALVVTADDQARAYGAANPTLSGSLVGVQNGDNVTASYSTVADTNSVVGNYDIVPQLSDPDSKLSNYSVTTNRGTLHVTAASLVVTANDQSRVYGSPNPSLTGTVTGVQNNDGITATYATTADTTSSVGTYVIVATLNDPNSKLGNYSVTTNNGTLTVTAATLIVTAGDKSRVYGSANPMLTGTLIGVQNGDGISATYSTTADTTSAVGTYAIVPALNDPNSKLTNYSVTISNGTLTINPAGSTLALISSLNPSASSSNVTFTATVAAVSPATVTPSGTVQFFANGVALGSPAVLVNGVADVNTSSLASGSNAIAAVYDSNSNFLPSTNTLVQVVTLNLAQPITLGIQHNGNGTVTVSFQGTPGGQYIVQSTTNLGLPNGWSNVSTNTAGSDGIWTYTDSTAPRPRAFYRAMK